MPELEVATLAAIPGSPESLADLDDFGETLEPIEPSELEQFYDLDTGPDDLTEESEKIAAREQSSFTIGVSKDDIQTT